MLGAAGRWGSCCCLLMRRRRRRGAVVGTMGTRNSRTGPWRAVRTYTRKAFTKFSISSCPCPHPLLDQTQRDQITTKQASSASSACWPSAARPTPRGRPASRAWPCRPRQRRTQEQRRGRSRRSGRCLTGACGIVGLPPVFIRSYISYRTTITTTIITPQTISALFADDAALSLLAPALRTLPALLTPILHRALCPPSPHHRGGLGQALLEALLTSVQRQLVLAAAGGGHGAAVWTEVRRNFTCLDELDEEVGV